jgi:hypothetical protein
MKRTSSSSATQGVRVEANKKRVTTDASQQPKTNAQARESARLRVNILVNASQLASTVMRNPVLHEAFWDSYTLSMEHKCGMSFWNFLVKRFTMN